MTPEKPIPAVAGVNLPSAHDEAVELMEWIHDEYGPFAAVVVHRRIPSPPVVLFLRPTPRSHGLVLPIVRVDGTKPSWPSDYDAWLDDLTLRGYRTAVCAGFLCAQREVLNYLKS